MRPRKLTPEDEPILQAAVLLACTKHFTSRDVAVAHRIMSDVITTQERKRYDYRQAAEDAGLNDRQFDDAFYRAWELIWEALLWPGEE
jgi:hypothetical protein